MLLFNEKQNEYLLSCTMKKVTESKNSSLLNSLVIRSICQNFRKFQSSCPKLKNKTNKTPKISHVMRVCPTCFSRLLLKYTDNSPGKPWAMWNDSRHIYTSMLAFSLWLLGGFFLFVCLLYISLNSLPMRRFLWLILPDSF